jgi:hypothetical protein
LWRGPALADFTFDAWAAQEIARLEELRLEALVAAAAVAAVILLSSGGASITVAPNSVAVIDPARNAVTRAIAVGARPGDISAGAGGLWVANLGDDSVSKIDPRAARVARTWSTGKSVDGLTTAGGAVWTLDGPDATALRIDPNFGQVVNRTRLGTPPGDTSTERSSPIGAAPNAVWASTGNAAVARLATSTGTSRGRRPSATSPPASPTAPERPGSRTTSTTTSHASIAPGS